MFIRLAKAIADFDDKQQIKRYFNKTDVYRLSKKGKYLLSLCENKRVVNGYNDIVWQHHLPLRDEVYGHTHFNYRLKSSELERVDEFTNDLRIYARIILLAYKHYDINIAELYPILPPWIVFPLHAANSPFWKEKIGKSYLMMYFDILREMKPKNRRKFTKDFPVPLYFQEMFYGFNIEGIHMEDSEN